MATKIFTDRSRIEQYQRCARSRWLAYHEGGRGIAPIGKPLPLAVGGSVHVGLAVMLQYAQDWLQGHASNEKVLDEGVRQRVEDEAVQAALEDFAHYAGKLEVDAGELPQGTGAATPKAYQAMDALLAGSATPASFGDPELDDAWIQGGHGQAQDGKRQFEEYLYHEQAALIEGLVRAYARRRLRPLLEQFEVLEVEREGEWLLSEMYQYSDPAEGVDNSKVGELWFMSRPDALLLDRQTGQLVLLSYKTAASWDRRKAMDAEHDMQGLSEAVEVERRLGDWWRGIRANISAAVDIEQENGGPLSEAMLRFLMATPAPPRILSVRYEYMLKGERWKDKDLSAKVGFECRTQKSLLTRAYVAMGMAAGDEQFNWSYDFHKEDGSPSKLYAKNWPGREIWSLLSAKDWVDKLDATVEAVGDEGRPLGWQGPAQASGYTDAHPLDALFVAPVTIYRQEDDMRDLVEQMEAQEVRVAQAVAMVAGATDEGERRSLLNQHFAQSRKACSYPSECSYTKICYGGEQIRRDPLGSGLYVIRELNHPQEGQGGQQ